MTGEHFRLTPEPEPVKIVREIPTPPQASGKKAAKISFEDYHLTWSGIATSKSDKNSKNPCKSFHERFKINYPLKFCNYMDFSCVPDCATLMFSVLEAFQKNVALETAHYGLQPDELQDQIQRQLQE